MESFEKNPDINGIPIKAILEIPIVKKVGDWIDEKKLIKRISW